jgi:cellulose biosynthesis protein BcsQ
VTTLAQPRSKPWTICFFNNKGGVGKTTLACNVASYLARTEELRVLVVDADPQCNASQLILGSERAAEIYSTGTLNNGIEEIKVNTLKDVLAPISAGEATLSKNIHPVSSALNRFRVDLIPGHPKVAILEDKLSRNWTEFVGGDLGGARVTNWNTQFLAQFEGKYDLIVFDIGPSLGALNRAVLVGVDFFLAPMGCDIFSLIGIDNIAEWLHDWQGEYETGLKQCEKKHGNEMDNYVVKNKTQAMCRFVGYTVQQYITKTIRNERRATAAYDEILASIPARIEQRLAQLIAPKLDLASLKLGDVPHMFSLVPLAQTAASPIDLLVSSDGLSGGQYGQQTDYKRFIGNLSTSLLRNLMNATEEVAQ